MARVEQGAAIARVPRILIVMVLLLGGLVCVALCSGLPGMLSPELSLSQTDLLILREIRLPRVLLAVSVGAGLGAAGAALQALLQNPLAEPGILGISSGAALGAVLAFYTGLASVWPLALPVGGLCGAALVTAALLLLAWRTLDATSLLLAGVALSSLLGACVALVLALVPNPYAVYELYFWLLGSVADRSLTHAALAVPPIAAGIALLWSAHRGLAVLALGEEAARSLGLAASALRVQIILGTALATGPGVAVAGVVGFVGMLVPHLVRRLVGTESPGILVPLSALGGAGLTLAADLVVQRAGLLGAGLRLGIVTALLGAPLFLFIALRLSRGPLR